MTRSSKLSNVSWPRSPVFGPVSAAAVAILFLFLCLQSSSFVGDPPFFEPQGSWKQVHHILGISLDTSSTARRNPLKTELSHGHNLPLHLVNPSSNQEPKDKADFLRDFATALRSTPRRFKRRQ